ncbi:hypothetical protein [Gudongella sp. DL1XJH-153]|uniref:hypothetical protein n=1 Tax=Gudongella sp. DL1XJH-153 TaxID=3409804 RepID=UPI003BB54A93
MNQLMRFLAMMLVVVLIFLGSSILGDNTSYQGTVAIPLQRNLYSTNKVNYKTEDGEVNLSIKAEYDIRGFVKGKRKYSDYSSQVSDYDIILVWGDLNKEEYDQFVNYSQSGRWYYYTYETGRIDQSFIAKNSANVHLIPENDEVKREIKKIDKNDYIRIEGYLVDVHFDSGDWKTSMTRGDTGNGACEIIFVKELHIVD